MLRYPRYYGYLFASSSRKEVTFFNCPFLMLGYYDVFDLFLFICRIISYYRRYRSTGTSVPFSSKTEPGRDTTPAAPINCEKLLLIANFIFDFLKVKISLIITLELVRTDIGLSYALTYFCPDKSSVSSLRPVSSCREAPANCKTGIFPTARCNHGITVCPALLQPIIRRTHQHDTPAIMLLCVLSLPY